MAQLLSINISEAKGTLKKPIPEASLTLTGIQGDAHGGGWHRMVSLLSRECMDAFGAQANTTFNCGDFAENLTTQGLDLTRVGIRDRLKVGETELEVTQIGKDCHGGGCAVFQQVGRCVMPKEGIFARVLRAGRLRPGDPIEHHPKPLKACVITLSDRASRGEYEDLSGPAIRKELEAHFASTRWHLETAAILLPDDAAALEACMKDVVRGGADIVITTGGTGIGPRDITPDVVAPLLDKQIPGIMDMVRVKHGERLPSALLSRSIAGVMGQTLVYCLPGSVKAVREYLSVILPTLHHSLLMLAGIDAH